MTDARMQQTEILQEMATITRMRKGHLTEQYNRKQTADGSERRWGPYYTLQAWVGGKNRSERIPAEQSAAVRQDLENYATFSTLCDRYIQVSEGVAKAEATDSKKSPNGSGGYRSGSRAIPRHRPREDRAGSHTRSRLVRDHPAGRGSEGHRQGAGAIP